MAENNPTQIKNDPRQRRGFMLNAQNRLWVIGAAVFTSGLLLISDFQSIGVILLCISIVFIAMALRYFLLQDTGVISMIENNPVQITNYKGQRVGHTFISQSKLWTIGIITLILGVLIVYGLVGIGVILLCAGIVFI